MNAHARIDTRPAPEAVAAVVAGLTRILGNRCVTSAAVREQHASTLTWIANEPPDAVVFPMTTEEVVEVVKLCAAHRVPVIPFGTGSSLEGHVNAPLGGVSIDTSMMKAIKAVHPEDLDCVVEPGVTRKQLNEYLRDQGLFFPIDPGADASIGGMTATRASGTNAVRYGTMKDNVIAVKAVLASGEVIETARRAKKTSAGYDLTRLFVGSEGTLGIITEITLRLQGIPEAISAATCSFGTIKDACDAAILTIQSGIPIARVEFLDAQAIRATNAYAKLALREAPMLFVEFHGTEASVKEQAERFGEIAQSFGSIDFHWTTKARSGRSSGRRGTTPTGPRWLSVPAPRASRPTSACRFRVWPNASTIRSATSRRAASSARSSAMSATVISTCCRSSTWRTRTRSTGARPSSAALSSALWTWGAPARANMAWGRAR